METKELVYAMRISKLADNDYFIDYPLPGMSISASAESLSEAVELARESLEFTLFDMYESKEDFPTSNEKDIMQLELEKDQNQYITLITTNLGAILARYGNDPVKKMVSIKQYQQFYLEKNDVSLSKYIQKKIDADIQK